MGFPDGFIVERVMMGIDVGLYVGHMDGRDKGFTDGIAVGSFMGIDEGSAEDFTDGRAVGRVICLDVGFVVVMCKVGLVVAMVTALEG